jgi:hypothetical protein
MLAFVNLELDSTTNSFKIGISLFDSLLSKLNLFSVTRNDDSSLGLVGILFIALVFGFNQSDNAESGDANLDIEFISKSLDFLIVSSGNQRIVVRVNVVKFDSLGCSLLKLRN